MINYHRHIHYGRVEKKSCQCLKSMREMVGRKLNYLRYLRELSFLVNRWVWQCPGELSFRLPRSSFTKMVENKVTGEPYDIICNIQWILRQQRCGGKWLRHWWFYSITINAHFYVLETGFTLLTKFLKVSYVLFGTQDSWLQASHWWSRVLYYLICYVPISMASTSLVSAAFWASSRIGWQKQHLYVLKTPPCSLVRLPEIWKVYYRRMTPNLSEAWLLALTISLG